MDDAESDSLYAFVAKLGKKNLKKVYSLIKVTINMLCQFKRDLIRL